MGTDGTMICECYSFKRCGLFCVHQVKVTMEVHKAVDVDSKGFAHYDVSIHYLGGYMHLAYRASTPKKIKQMYHHLASNIRGPKICVQISKSMLIEEKDAILPVLERLKTTTNMILIWISPTQCLVKYSLLIQ